MPLVTPENRGFRRSALLLFRLVRVCMITPSCTDIEIRQANLGIKKIEIIC